MDKLNLLGSAGMRPTGIDNRAVQGESEVLRQARRENGAAGS